MASLCGRWLFLGSVNVLNDMQPVNGDCVACVRKWKEAGGTEAAPYVGPPP